MADNTSAANGNSLLETTKNSMSSLANAAAAYQSVANGPVAQNVYDHTQKAGGELSNLAAARRTPATPAATGQPLTHYHSFFSELLSWNNPRASGIAYATIITSIFAARYLDVLRWSLKASWMVLGVTILAEVLGKAILNNGLATQVRPRRYYTVPRETLDALIGDVHELINFFVIEAQRIIFAENVFASAAAFVAAFISYFLVKLVPIWGLALIGTTVAFALPLIYTSNQELIDEQLHHASEIINSQTAQIQNVASKQMEQVSNISKQYAGDYSGKVQDLLRGKTPSRQKIDHKPEPVLAKQPEFPSPPTEEPIKTTAGGAPQIPTPAALKEELNEPTAINTAAPELPHEPVVPNKQPMFAS
ncbi:Ff.00g029020.m01.CDS01 [Fusarium sp. VM40]|nr:Ff.00g029020.m01.CDS01 [Fusarium sp. VM40]